MKRENERVVKAKNEERRGATRQYDEGKGAVTARLKSKQKEAEKRKKRMGGRSEWPSSGRVSEGTRIGRAKGNNRNGIAMNLRQRMRLEQPKKDTGGAGGRNGTRAWAEKDRDAQNGGERRGTEESVGLKGMGVRAGRLGQKNRNSRRQDGTKAPGQELSKGEGGRWIRRE